MNVMSWIAGLLSAFVWISAADAGAWPREKDAWFISGSVSLSWPQDAGNPMAQDPAQQYNALYIEYGMTERVTLGFDLGRSVSGGGKTIVFLQYPLRNKDTGMKAAAQIGFGSIDEQPVVRPGLSVGWGRENGWVSIDSVAEYGLEKHSTDWKMDITWGRNLPKDRKLILQLQLGDPAVDDPFARFAPSMVFTLNKRLKLETGGIWGLTGDDQMGLKFGLWTEF